MTDNNVFVSIPSQKSQRRLSGPMDLQKILERIDGLRFDDVYIVHNGKKLVDKEVIKNGTVHVVPRLPGGKGGFGSMLRAIGAQIEKTTNREACRDLSGRRLRDINEEKRLKSWITQQADRERDAAERKRLRLERLMAEPKLEFKDPEYDAARSEMPEKISDAVDQGFKLASTGSSKRAGPSTSTSAPPLKRKKCLWLDADEEDISSGSDASDSDDDKVKVKKSESTKSVECEKESNLESKKGEIVKEKEPESDIKETASNEEKTESIVTEEKPKSSTSGSK